jgi:6-pyruvoyltetrahydropterin/6-carboxytetrahydropterin synthase
MTVGDGGATEGDGMTERSSTEHLSTGRPSIDRASLHTDGGSRGNPGASGIGFTIQVDDGRELAILCRGGAYIGTATNNVAEYRALIWGLRNALALKVRKIDIYADSELLVKQILGTYRVKNAGIKPLFSEAQQLLAGFEHYQVQHVPRELNSAADELANEAMDTRGMVGDFAVAYETGDLFSLALSASSDKAAPNAAPDTTPSATPSDQTKADTRPAPDTSRKGNVMTDMGATGIYTLTIKEHFDAAHALVGYPGQCANLHGHTWDVEVSVRGTELDEVGIVYDFKDLKNNLWGILEQYDHAYLNEVPPFDAINATAENLARVIYEQLAETLPEGVELVEVAVWESPIAKLTYSR